ncbi:MAG: hypothetical protein HKN33_11830 [Pyrinomonadaceae bacterium]|nr:hypothetical protein [Pyrinomonadaceae bacterium]
MKLSKESAVEHAKTDLAGRLSKTADEISIKSVKDEEFRDMSLGATATGEVAAQMISYGWRIVLAADGKEYEYRGDKYQLRLVGFNGQNHLVIG